MSCAFFLPRYGKPTHMHAAAEFPYEAPGRPFCEIMKVKPELY